MNGLEADNYELRLNYSKEVLAKSVCQNGTKEEYQDTCLNCQQLGTESLKPADHAQLKNCIPFLKGIGICLDVGASCILMCMHLRRHLNVYEH